MRQTPILLTLLLFSLTLILPALPAHAGEEAYQYIYIIISGSHTYLIPYLYVDPTPSLNSNRTIGLTLYRQHDAYPPTWYNTLLLENNATVTATITLPNSTQQSVTFNNQDNGNYTYTYNFSTEGTYKVELLVNRTFDSIYTRSTAYVYVGQFTINAEFTGETTFYKGDSINLVLTAKDNNQNPVLEATANLTVYYPNGSTWINSLMKELGGGTYYYNATTSIDIEGTYSISANVTKGSASDTASTSLYITTRTTSIGGSIGSSSLYSSTYPSAEFTSAIAAQALKQDMANLPVLGISLKYWLALLLLLTVITLTTNQRIRKELNRMLKPTTATTLVTHPTPYKNKK